MALTPAGIIQQARELDAAFVRRIHPDEVLRSYLSRYQRSLVSELVAIDPSVVASMEPITLPLATFADGHTMPSEVLTWISIDAVRADGQVDPVQLVAFNDRHTTHFFPAVYFQAGVLYLVGVADQWTAWDTVRAYYVETPAAVASKDTTLVLPDTAEDLLVACLGDFMARRVKQGISQPLGIYREDLAIKRAAFMKLHHQRGGVAVTTVEEVW